MCLYHTALKMSRCLKHSGWDESQKQCIAALSLLLRHQQLENMAITARSSHQRGSLALNQKPPHCAAWVSKGI